MKAMNFQDWLLYIVRERQEVTKKLGNKEQIQQDKINNFRKWSK